MASSTRSAISVRVPANRLSHHVLEWPAERSGGRTVVLVHGYMDAGGTWDRVAPALAAAGHRVLAPDVRGFGDGARAPEGAYYHFVDYVFDLADVVDALSPTSRAEPIVLVGHSMGGTIATLFAGTFPERVAKLADLEGLGPPDNEFSLGPIRMRRWIEEVRVARARGVGRPTFTREEAMTRLRGNHPNVPPEILATRLPHLVEEVEGGRVRWRFDPLHRTTSPMPFFAKLFAAYAARVTCPVLFVSGGPLGFHPPDEEERLAAFATLTRLTIDDAGHMMHWTKPDEVARALLDFIAS